MASAAESNVTVEGVIKALNDAAKTLTELIEATEKTVAESGIEIFLKKNFFTLFPAASTVVTLASVMGCKSAESLSNTLQEITSKEGDNEELLTALEEFNRSKQLFDDYLDTLDTQLGLKKPETKLPLSELKIENAKTSLSSSLEDLFSKEKWTWIVFLRNYYCPLCCAHVEALAAVKDKLEELHCQVIVLAAGEAAGSHLFNKNVNCPFDIFIDSSKGRQVYSRYNVNRSIRKIFGSHAWPLFAEFVFSGKQVSKPYEGIKDDHVQMGADFVFDSAGKIVFSNLSKSVFDRPNISSVMALLQETKL